MKIIIVNDLEKANAYILYDEDTKEAVIFDPGADAKKYLDLLEQNGLDLKKIILTHGHYDHIGGVEELREKTGASVYIPETDQEFLTNPNLNMSSFIGAPIAGKPADVLLHDDEEIEILPDVKLKTIATPGHTPGGMCFAGDGFIIVGDILFQGSIGRTDFPGGSYAEIMDSIKRLLEYDDETLILPGHGEVTKIGIERATNPFLQNT